MKKTSWIVGFALLFSFFVTGVGLADENGVQAALQKIQDAKIRAHAKFLSDDLLEGRGVGSRGEEIAIRYIVAQFMELGLLPGGENGTYLQKVPMVATTPNPAMSLRFQSGDQTIDTKYRDDFIAVSPLQTEKVSIENKELVFVGYGIQASEYDWDDYKGMDMRGKVLLFLNNDPDQGDPNLFGGKARLYYGRWTYKYEMAAKMGAEGAIIIHTTPSAGYPWQVVQSSWSGEQYQLPLAEPKAKMEGWITEDKIRQILKTKGVDLDILYAAAEKRDFQPIPLGIGVSIDITSTNRSMQGTNVLGLLPGSDPVLKDQVEIFTAHHDHLGIGDPVDGDTIYNGALDNASGIACMLSVADAFCSLPTKPRRSILFMTVTAEESGLLGSDYYAKHPSFPPDKIAALFNMDGTNLLGKTRDLVVLGFDKSNLEEPLNEVAASQGRVVLADQMPEQGSFYRSDHFSFAKIGVPSLSFESGLDFIGKPEGWGKAQVDEYIEKHYHQPSDEYDPNWNLEGAIEDAQLIFQVALKVANQDDMPQWKPSDEFEKLRKP